ncbi:major facilitator superfamily domain-containing protein [Umbelopsis sp. AD052]|nr:major facilitator superfamily domain-containing protein [Umbelopsis sp. AD052]
MSTQATTELSDLAKTEQDTNAPDQNIEVPERSLHQEQMDTDHLPKRVLIPLCLSLCLCLFMAALDQTIVTVALPRIASDFNALADISWVGSAFLITSTAFQGLYGKCSTIFGYKIMILFAMFFFLGGSLICALSTGIVMLIIGRAIAGIGGAGIQTMCQIIIAVVCPIQDRSLYQGILGAAYMVGTTIGPLIGGAFTDHLNWRWAFYINLPIGAVAAIAVTTVLRHQPAPNTTWKERFSRIDYLGTLLLVGWVVAFLLPLSWGGSTYPWNSAVIISLFCVFGVLFIVFVLVQWKYSKEPLMPARVFTVHRNPPLVFASSILSGMCLLGIMYYVPILFQEGMGNSATIAGVKCIPFMVTSILASVSAGVIINVFLVYRPVICLGGALVTTGAGLMTLWTRNSNVGTQVGFMIVCGFGMGWYLQGIIISAQAASRKEDLPVTTGLISFCRSLGGSIGVTVFGSVFNNALLHTLPKDVPNISESVVAAALSQNQAILSTLPEATRNAIANASVDALRYVFYAIIGLMGAATLLGFATGHVQLSKEELEFLQEIEEA